MGTLEEVRLEFTANTVNLTADKRLIKIILVLLSYFRVGQLVRLHLDAVSGRVSSIKPGKVVGLLRQEVV